MNPIKATTPVAGANTARVARTRCQETLFICRNERDGGRTFGTENRETALGGVMELDRDQAIDVLNEIVEIELAGAVRYTQYALMVFGHGRIPITSWMQEQATEGLLHATAAGEEVTTLGGRPTLRIGELVGTHHATVDEIMQELLVYERRSLEAYGRLLRVVDGSSVSLEEYARQMIRLEELHIAEVGKMLRKRGDA